MSLFLEMEDNRPPTTTEAIQAFERERNISLPQLYKDFLLATNGGRPKNPIFPIHGMALNPTGMIQVFAGIGVPVPTSELSWGYDFYLGRIPKNIVPIAGDGGGDWVCLDLRGGEERVAFWDFRHHWGTGEWRESDLYHIADSLEEFFASLKPNNY